MLNFEYPEDGEYFAKLLAGGDIIKLEEKFSELFDFRHHAIKRWEFNKIKKRVMSELMERFKGQCQLKIHPDCSKDGKYQPDHIIPLATNELNKKLRHIGRSGSEKVLAQNFGSNHPKNLTLACKRCNAFKKHKFLISESLVKTLELT